MTFISPVILEGILWSALWMAMVFVLIRYFPWLIEHDYPPDIREAAHTPAPTPRQKRKGNIFTIISYIVLIGTLIFLGLIHYIESPVSFGVVFLHIWIICFMWNVVDLLIVDWLIVCKITPKWMMISGTEHCRGWKDYGFHLKGFLRGCVFMTLFGLISAGIDFAVLYFFIW